MLAEQRVVVTGSTYGIGKGIAEAMLRAGARVVVNSNEPPRDDVLEQFQRIGECHFVQADLSDVQQARDLVRTACQKLGGLDCLVNNAGTFTGKRFTECEEGDYDRIMNLNVRGYFFASQAFARLVQKRDFDASIVCTGSTNGILAEKNSVLYDMSKGAILMLVRSLAVSLADLGIRVNGVAPGLIRTPLHKQVVEQDPKLVKLLRAQIPMGRSGDLDDIGPVAVFLASKAAKYITGEMIYADGGLSAQQTIWELPDSD